MIYSLVAVAAAIIVVVGRYLVSTKITRLNQEVLDQEKALRQAKLELKASENKKQLAELDLKQEEASKRKLEVQIQKCDKELADKSEKG